TVVFGPLLDLCLRRGRADPLASIMLRHSTTIPVPSEGGWWKMDVRIDAERLWHRHVEMARLGGTPKGGVCRLALTDEDIKAHLLLEKWARNRGFSVALDDIGNMLIRRDGTDPDAAPVASGSHTDTQPTGGRFDGIYGVLAAFEALEAIDDAGIRMRRPLEAIVWNNEEGSRFHPGCMGSAVHAGVSTLEEMLAKTDRAGVTMG